MCCAIGWMKLVISSVKKLSMFKETCVDISNFKVPSWGANFPVIDGKGASFTSWILGFVSPGKRTFSCRIVDQWLGSSTPCPERIETREHLNKINLAMQIKLASGKLHQKLNNQICNLLEHTSVKECWDSQTSQGKPFVSLWGPLMKQLDQEHKYFVRCCE